jgi:hypothetical protein
MLLLARDSIALYEPGAVDAHGWREPPPGDAEPLWAGLGNHQPQAGRSDPLAAEGGGRGPFEPARDAVANLYLPPEAGPLVDGMTAVIEGVPYVLSQTRRIDDPLDPDDLTCWVAVAAAFNTWKGGGV